MIMTKRQVKAALGIATDAELARQFRPPIGRWAVGQWPEDEPIPKLRRLQLIVDFPDIFGADKISTNVDQQQEVA